MAFGLLKNNESLLNTSVAAKENTKKSPEELMRSAMREVAAKQMAATSPDIIVARSENTVSQSSFSELAKAIRSNSEVQISEEQEVAPPLKSYLIEEVSPSTTVASNDNLPPEVNIFAANDNNVEEASAKDTIETVNFTAEQVRAWQASDVHELRALGDHLAMRERTMEINAEIADMAEKLEAEVANQLAKEESYRSIASFSKSESVSSDPFIAELVKTLLTKAEQRSAKAEEAKADFEAEEARLKSEIGPHMEIDPKIMMLAKVLDSMRAKNSLLNEGRKKLMPAANDNSRIEAARISQESGEDTAALFINALTAKAA
jgi:hypothetical protein